MKQKLPWYKRHVADWRSGTRGETVMPIELRGFYSECLDAMWERQAQLSKDPFALAIATATNVRLVRALMPKLVAEGKMIETETGYYNPRMMADILGVKEVAPEGAFKPVPKPTQSSTNPDTVPNGGSVDTDTSSTGDPLEVGSNSKSGKNPTNTTRALEGEGEEEREEDKDTPLPPKGGPAASEILQAFQDYNSTALQHGLPQAAKLTPDRKRKIRARLVDYGVDGWARALANIGKSKFLRGLEGGRKWRCSLDFLTSPDGFSKVHDNVYGTPSQFAIGAIAHGPVQPSPPKAPEVQTYRTGTPEFERELAAARREDPARAATLEMRGWVKTYPLEHAA